MGLFDKIDKLKTLSEQIGLNLPNTNTTQTTSPTNTSTQTTTSITDNCGELYNPQMEQLINMALADGKLTEKEKQVLFKRAQSMGIDLDEFEMVLDARLYKMSQQQTTQQSMTSAPKSDKYGDVKKCPACGSMIESFTSSCPECGHVFSNITANSSIQKLFEMLNKVESYEKESPSTIKDVFVNMLDFDDDDETKTRKKKTIIQNFPIPTTKDDILEFLSLAVPLARKPGIFSKDPMAKDMYPVWKAKCEQIIMKAKFSMRDDKRTLDMIKEYADELKIKM